MPNHWIRLEWQSSWPRAPLELDPSCCNSGNYSEVLGSEVTTLPNPDSILSNSGTVCGHVSFLILLFLKFYWSIVLEKTLKESLGLIKPVNPKGNQPWIFMERTDAEAEAPILWPPDASGRLTGKDPDAGKDWAQEEKEAGGPGRGGGDRERDCWMASPYQWTWVWANSRR